MLSPVKFQFGLPARRTRAILFLITTHIPVSKWQRVLAIWKYYQKKTVQFRGGLIVITRGIVFRKKMWFIFSLSIGFLNYNLKLPILWKPSINANLIR